MTANDQPQQTDSRHSPDIEAGNPVSDSSALCRIVLQYRDVMKRLVDQAKLPGFSVCDWAPLGELVDAREFKRVGPFLEEMSWREYTEFLTQWALSSGWDSTFRRIHEWSGVVFLELEERSVIGEKTDVVNSLSVYEFNAAGKIRRLDIYLQRRI